MFKLLSFRRYTVFEKKFRKETNFRKQYINETIILLLSLFRKTYFRRFFFSKHLIFSKTIFFRRRYNFFKTKLSLKICSSLLNEMKKSCYLLRRHDFHVFEVNNMIIDNNIFILYIINFYFNIN